METPLKGAELQKFLPLFKEKGGQRNLIRELFQAVFTTVEIDDKGNLNRFEGPIGEISDELREALKQTGIFIINCERSEVYTPDYKLKAEPPESASTDGGVFVLMIDPDNDQISVHFGVDQKVKDDFTGTTLYPISSEDDLTYVASRIYDTGIAGNTRLATAMQPKELIFGCAPEALAETSQGHIKTNNSDADQTIIARDKYRVVNSLDNFQIPDNDRASLRTFITIEADYNYS